MRLSYRTSFGFSPLALTRYSTSAGVATLPSLVSSCPRNSLYMAGVETASNSPGRISSEGSRCLRRRRNDLGMSESRLGIRLTIRARTTAARSSRFNRPPWSPLVVHLSCVRPGRDLHAVELRRAETADDIRRSCWRRVASNEGHKHRHGPSMTMRPASIGGLTGPLDLAWLRISSVLLHLPKSPEVRPQEISGGIT